MDESGSKMGPETGKMKDGLQTSSPTPCLRNALTELRHGLVQFLIQKRCLDSDLYLLSGMNEYPLFD